MFLFLHFQGVPGGFFGVLPGVSQQKQKLIFKEETGRNIFSVLARSGPGTGAKNGAAATGAAAPLLSFRADFPAVILSDSEGSFPALALARRMLRPLGAQKDRAFPVCDSPGYFMYFFQRPSSSW